MVKQDTLPKVAKGTDESLQETVRRLQEQYTATGGVQAFDLSKVLGGPTGTLEVSLKSDDPAARWVIR